MKLGLVAALVLSATVLTGCSDSPKLAGSAVLIDGKVIPATTVADLVDRVRSQIQVSDPALIPEVPSLVQINQRAVARIVLVELLKEAAEREGLEVSDRDVITYRDEVFAQYSQEAIESQLVAQNAVPADNVDSFMHEILLQRMLMDKLAPQASTQTQTLALFDYLTNLSKELDVKLNPRFGTWDPENLISNSGDTTLAVPLPISLG